MNSFFFFFKRELIVNRILIVFLIKLSIIYFKKNIKNINEHNMKIIKLIFYYHFIPVL